MNAKEIRSQSNSIESRVTLGLKLKSQGEEMVARALREKLDKVGQSEWLTWCKDCWGWGRRQAYAHLNPEQLQKDRDRKHQQGAESPHPASRQEVSEPADEPYVPPGPADVSRSHSNSLRQFLRALLNVSQSLTASDLAKEERNVNQVIADLDKIMDWLTEYRKELLQKGAR